MMKSNYLDVLISYKLILKEIKNFAKILLKWLEQNNNLIIICILNGSVMFYVDLIREVNKLGYTKKINLEYIFASSYENVVSKDLKLKKWVNRDIENQEVVIIEDIIDTGKTLKQIKRLLFENNKIKNLNVISLLDKKSVHLNIDLDFDYHALFVVENDYLVGYGLDCDEKFRQLRDVCVYKV